MVNELCTATVSKGICCKCLSLLLDDLIIFHQAANNVEPICHSEKHSGAKNETGEKYITSIRSVCNCMGLNHGLQQDPATMC